MSALDAIRADIEALRDTLAGINARREQINPEIEDHEQQIAALKSERIRCLHDSEQAAMAIARLERAEALLSEQVEPVAAGDDDTDAEQYKDELRRWGDPDPQVEVVPAPSATRTRIRSELDEITRARHEAEDAAKRPSPATGTGHRGGSLPALLDPLSVKPRDVSRGRDVGPREPLNKVGEGGYARELPAMLASPVWAERAKLIVEILEAHDGACSGIVLRDYVAATLDCKPTTAQTTVSRALAVLHHQGRVMNTGQMEDASDGRPKSPIWKLKEES